MNNLYNINIVVSDDKISQFYYTKHYGTLNGSINKSNFSDVNLTSIKNKSFYRFPKLALPREKVEILKNKHNISIVRDKDKADYLIVSKTYINSLSDRIYTRIIKNNNDLSFFVSDYKDYFNTESYNDILNFLSILNPDDIIITRSLYYRSSLEYLLDGWNNMLKADWVTRISLDVDYLKKNKHKIVYDSDLYEYINDELNVMNYQSYVTVKKMLNNKSEINFGLDLMANCNLDKSFQYIAILFYFYYEKIRYASNFNAVNVKSLRTALDKYVPTNTNTRSQYLYAKFLETTIEDGKFTKFIFEETIRFMFHNLVAKELNLNKEDSIFTLDPKAIKINPNYLEKIRKSVFNNNIEDAISEL